MAAHDLLKLQAKTGDASDGLFWLDPWSRDGQNYAAKLRPYTRELRLHAERALTLIAQARAAHPCPAPHAPLAPVSEQSDSPCGATSQAGTAPSGTDHPASLALTRGAYPPTALREADAIDALELGARRIDFIGLKFQLADEIPTLYAKAQADAASTDKKTHSQVIYDLADIRGVNGRLEDVMDGYSLLRDLYEQMWLRTDRPYALRPVLEHFDYTIGIWYSRIDRLRSVERQYDDLKTLPSPADLGLPPVVSTAQR